MEEGSLKVYVDSDVLIEVLRGSPDALEWIERISDANLVAPGIVVVELLEGCSRKQDLLSVQRLISTIKVEWPTERVFRNAIDLFDGLKLRYGIGMLDCLIAASVIEESGLLYTFNQRHFQHVLGLRFQAPYSRIG